MVFSSSHTGNEDLYAVSVHGGPLTRVVGTENAAGAMRYHGFRNPIVHQRMRADQAALIADGLALFKSYNADVAPNGSPLGDLIRVRRFRLK